MNKRLIILLALLALILSPSFIFAQQDAAQKFALVIGNGSYNDLSRLSNPVNDANDVADLLEHLGFAVDKVLNGNLEQMEDAVARLQNNLSMSHDSYGFFFYAGHGVQSGGDNFLIPVDANIPGENHLRTRAVSVQVILDDLNDARNSLNVVVLDACRDNPFGWSRSGTRGLTMIGRQPADSIIVYATSAGQRASDGEGRNGLFTSQLLLNLSTPGLEVKEVFNRTGADVSAVSNRQQIPAIYNQFFGTAYLGAPPSDAALASVYVPGTVRPSVQPSQDRGNNRNAKLWTIGASLGSSFTAPWIIGTARGTIAPFSYSFLALGIDFGFVSGISGVGYNSFFPFAHYAFYLPVKNWGGWYAGAGGGYLITRLSYPEVVPVNIFAFEAITGINLFGFLDISYALRTDFAAAGSKVSVGYTYRFR